MRVLFRLGDAQLAQPRPADDLAQGVLCLARRERHRQVFELFVVQRQWHKREVAKRGRGKWSNPGSVNASVNWISRSPRRQQKTTASPSAIRPTGVPGRVHGDQRFERIVGLARAIRRSDGLSEGGGAVGEMIGEHEQPFLVAVDG